MTEDGEGTIRASPGMVMKVTSTRTGVDTKLSPEGEVEQGVRHGKRIFGR